jgi:hypothetical protein
MYSTEEYAPTTKGPFITPIAGVPQTVPSMHITCPINHPLLIELLLSHQTRKNHNR